MKLKQKNSLELRFSKDKIEAGCDEAGRGCLAGPVVAFVFDDETDPAKLEVDALDFAFDIDGDEIVQTGVSFIKWFPFTRGFMISFS